MGIFFNKQNQSQEIKLKQFDVLSYGDLWSGTNYVDNELVITILNRISTDISTLNVNTYFKDDKKKNEMYYLLQRPNANESIANLLYQFSYKYFRDGYAFLEIVYDNKLDIVEIKNINYTGVEKNILSNGDINYKFNMTNGSTKTLNKDRVIYLSKSNSVVYDFADGLDNLNTIIKLINKSKESIYNSLSLNGKINGVLKIRTNVKGNKLKEAKDNFVKNFMGADNSSGIAVLQENEEFQQLNIDVNNLKVDEIKTLEKSIYNFFGVSENIVSGNYDAVEWSNYINTVIKPFINFLEQEMNYKMFTAKQIKAGYRVELDNTPLISTTIEAKAKYYQTLMSVGAMSPNDIRELEGLVPVEGLDVYNVGTGGTGIQVINGEVILPDNNIINENNTLKGGDINEEQEQDT